MLVLALMILFSVILLSVLGQLAGDSADLTPSGLVRSVTRGARVVGHAGTVFRPEPAPRG